MKRTFEKAASTAKLGILMAVMVAVMLSVLLPTAALAAEPPERPTGLAVAAAPSQVVLGWDDPQDPTITHYRIYRRIIGVHSIGEFQLHEPDTGSATPGYQDRSIEPGKSYVYRVTAVNAAGDSPWSGYARTRIKPVPIQAVSEDDYAAFTDDPIITIYRRPPPDTNRGTAVPGSAELTRYRPTWRAGVHPGPCRGYVPTLRYWDRVPW